MKLRLKKYSQYDHEIPDISSSLTVMNSITKKQIGLFTRRTQADLVSVEQLYNDIHTAEETGQQTIGWIRGVYPTRATAQAALDAKDLFVLEDAGKLLGAARINKAQVDSYAEGDWEFAARDEEVCVFTLW